MTALSPRLGSSTRLGTLPVWIGRVPYGVPPGSRVAHPSGKRLAYVLAPDGTLAALVEGGQVYGIPEPLATLVRGRYFGADAAESSSPS